MVDDPAVSPGCNLIASSYLDFHHSAAFGGLNRVTPLSLKAKSIDESASSFNGFQKSQSLDMKKIEAIIKPFKLEEVREALINGCNPQCGRR